MGKTRHGVDWMTLALATGTWALVLATLWMAQMTGQAMEDQVSELKKATELQWRPYLNIEHPYVRHDFIYTTGADWSSDTVGLGIDTIPFGSPLYNGVQRVRYSATRRARFWNSGLTPARITHMVSSVISKKEWFEKYGKSVAALVDTLYAQDEVKLWSTDYIVLPDSTVDMPLQEGLVRSMLKEDFEDYVRTDSMVITYPYTYVVYEDFFGHEYNAIYIQHLIQSVSLIADTPLFADTTVRTCLEQYRWDVH